MPPENRTGYGVKGLLSGFAALYCVFFLGFALLFFLSLHYLPDIWFKYALLVIFVVILALLAGYACYRESKRLDTFAVKITQELKITIEQVKEPTETMPRVIVSNPVPPSLDQGNKPKALKP